MRAASNWNTDAAYRALPPPPVSRVPDLSLDPPLPSIPPAETDETDETPIRFDDDPPPEPKVGPADEAAAARRQVRRRLAAEVKAAVEPVEPVEPEAERASAFWWITAEPLGIPLWLWLLILLGVLIPLYFVLRAVFRQ